MLTASKLVSVTPILRDKGSCGKWQTLPGTNMLLTDRPKASTGIIVTIRKMVLKVENCDLQVQEQLLSDNHQALKSLSTTLPQ